MTALILFRVTPGKWLKSACRATILGDLLLVCCLYDWISGSRHHHKGRWVYILFERLYSAKAPSSSTHTSTLNWNLPSSIRGYVSVKKIDSHIYGYTPIKIRFYKHTLPKSPNTSKNLTYTLDFQTQRHYPINLSHVISLSEI